jgi:phage-related protein
LPKSLQQPTTARPERYLATKKEAKTMELSYNELVQLEEAIRRNLAYMVEELNKVMEDYEDIDIAELEDTTRDLQSTTTLLRKTQQALKAYETEEQTEDATE